MAEFVERQHGARPADGDAGIVDQVGQRGAVERPRDVRRAGGNSLPVRHIENERRKGIAQLIAQGVAVGRPADAAEHLITLAYEIFRRARTDSG